MLTLAVHEPVDSLVIRPGEPVEVQSLVSIPAAVTVYADRDGDLTTRDDQAEIVGGRQDPGGAPQGVLWDTTQCESGTYKIIAVATAGNARTEVTAAGTVTINLPPTVRVDSLPLPGDTRIRWGTQAVTVTYTDQDPDDDATTCVLLDADGDAWTTDDQFALAVDRSDGNGSPQDVVWDTLDVAPGTYHYVVEITDGVCAPVTAVSTGTITIAVPTDLALSEMVFVPETDPVRKWDQKNDYIDDLAQGYIPAGGYAEIDLADVDPWGWYQEVLPLEDSVLREGDGHVEVLKVGLDPLTVRLYGAVWDYDNDYYVFHLESGTTVSWTYAGALPVTSELIPHPDLNPDGVVTTLGENRCRVETSGYYFYKQERRGYSPEGGTYDVPEGFPHFMCFRLDILFNQD